MDRTLESDSESGIDLSEGAIAGDIAAIGEELLAALSPLVAGVGSRGAGPVALARELGVDKVLTSRVLKALRSRDGVSAIHSMPGPEPLRRLIRHATARGLDQAVRKRAITAVDRYEALLKDRVGDRSRLDAILSAWLPSARREFELRRKQAAFKAMSQIKGVEAHVSHATVMLYPAANPDSIDVVWVNGFSGLHRVRPGATVKFASRRMPPVDAARHPLTLDGAPIDASDSLLVREFCSEPTPRLKVTQVEQSVFYTLDDGNLGSRDAVDLVYAEVNRGEISRYVPKGSGRFGYFFAEVSIPSEVLFFDVLMHRDLYPGGEPELFIYDTAFEGIASVNDRRRDIDRLDMAEAVEGLGRGPARLRSADAPRYAELVEHAASKAGFDLHEMRGYRCRVDYPLYGSQVTLAFRAQER